MKRKLYMLIAFTIAITSCTTETTNKSFDYGKVENNVYSNSFFNVKMSLPPEWVVQSKEQTENLIDAGENIMGDDKDLKAAIDASKINSAYLLTLFKHEIGSPVAYNPSLMVISENLKLAPGVKTGSDYLFHAASLLKKAQMNYVIDEEFKKIELNNEVFYAMDCEVESMGIVIKQRYYSTIKKGFAFSIITSYTSEEEDKELKSILNTLKFVNQ